MIDKIAYPNNHQNHGNKRAKRVNNAYPYQLIVAGRAFFISVISVI